MSEPSDNHENSSRFDLQEMLRQVEKNPASGGSGVTQVSQSDISSMFKKKKKGSDK